MATNAELEIVWDGGSLDLMGENDTDYGPVTIEALSEGTEWGNPQSIRRALFSALADGSASALERHDNRTVTVRLRLTAADSAALAGGEAPLHMLSGVQRAELRWTPPNAFAAPAVYIVVASDLTHQMDDFAERRVQRFYTLTLVCLPFALSVDPVAIEALPPFVAVPATLDACTSTTGWSATGASFAMNGDSTGVIFSVPIGSTGVGKLTKTLARTKRYLALEVEPINSSFGTGSRSAPTITTATGTITAGAVGVEGNWYFFDIDSLVGDITSISFLINSPSSAAPTREAYTLLTIAESDTPSASAGRQSLRVISTPGSARAAGSLLVEARDATDAGAGTALGRVIVYTGQQYDPRLSVGRLDTSSVDTAALSGRAVTLPSGQYFTFIIPAREFLTGSHSLWISAKGADAAAISWTTTVRAIGTSASYINTTDSLGTVASILPTTRTFVGTGYNLFNLGNLDLPGLDVGATSALTLRFELAITGGSATLDEVLVFNRTLGRLSVVDTRTMLALTETTPGVYETTTGATRVWLDAATVESPERIIGGRVNREYSLPIALSSMLTSWDGAHLFTPDATYLYVGTTAALDPVVTGEFRPAWHTHPAS